MTVPRMASAPPKTRGICREPSLSEAQAVIAVHSQLSSLPGLRSDVRAARVNESPKATNKAESQN
jgi:hypothetical protein